MAGMGGVDKSIKNMFVTTISPVIERGLGLLGLQSIMKKLISIVALHYCILQVAGNLNPVDGKCCPYGQVISVSENFTCSFAGNHGREIYQFQGHADFEAFSTCTESKNVSLTRLEDLVEPTIRANSACIDIMYDEEEDRSVPVMFRCASNGSSENTAGTGSLAVPRLLTLRMCCGVDHVYDVGKRDCVFEKHDLNVPSNFKILKENFEFVNVVRGAPPCKPAILDYVVNVTRDLRVLGDGGLEVVLATKNGPQTIMANENNMCLDPGISGMLGLAVIRACSEETFCDRNPCVRKCCPEDQAMIVNKCGKIPPEMPPGYFHNILHNVSVERGLKRKVDALESFDYGMLIGNPCKYGMFPLEQLERWYITPLGYIHLPYYKIYGHDEYCMDMFFGNAHFKDSIYPFLCFEDPKSWKYSPIRFGVSMGLKLISCIFLIVTLLVYISLPTLRNLHGKTLMCHVASLVVTYACLVSATFGPSTPAGIPGSKDSKNCKLRGFMTLISWIAAYSWLNVMCFDIWWTVSGLGGAATSRGQVRAHNKRFIIYSLYAWGFALFVTGVAGIADTTEFLSVYLRPNIGDNDCWFKGGPDLHGQLIFFIGPILIQQMANIIFFGLTARSCSRVKTEIVRFMVPSTDPRMQCYHADLSKYIMNIKLFIVMDVSCMFDVLNYFSTRYGVGPGWRTQFFYVSEVYSDLRGVLIFILFVLKPKIYYDLLSRLGCGTASNTSPTGGDANRSQNPQGGERREQQRAHIELATQHTVLNRSDDKKKSSHEKHFTHI